VEAPYYTGLEAFKLGIDSANDGESCKRMVKEHLAVVSE
jgi:hypothetical protein